jgi:tRNA G18 (ribose-2'-O)-methylase SpoU
MAVIRIGRFDDPRLEEYRNVRDSELLRRRNHFIAEGRLVVERLFESGHPVVSVLLNEASLLALQESLATIAASVPVYVCAADELVSLVGFDLHRGCLAIAERPADGDPREVARRADLLLVLEGVTDADNVGSAFRNAAAFGVGGVLLSPGCCDPLYRKSIRTSMGSVLRLPYARFTDWPRDLEALKAEGFTVIALTPRDHAIDLASCTRLGPRQRTALLVGSEGQGLTPGAEAMADISVRIPMRPDVDSLNLATATGIALYCLVNS